MVRIIGIQGLNCCEILHSSFSLSLSLSLKKLLFCTTIQKDKNKIRFQGHDVQQSFVESSDENIGKCADTNPSCGNCKR